VFPVDEVAAGNIVGIVGLEGIVLKTATLASTWACEPMKAITFQAKPMVRVAVEPLNHKDLAQLEAGLQSLYQYDPVVEVGVDDSGQHTMTCLGELHLEQCLKVLVEKFTK
jgi:ribosome assembly protein 1